VTTVWASAAAAAIAARAGIDPPSWGYLAAVLAASPLNALLLFLLVKAIRPASRSGSLSGRGWLNWASTEHAPNLTARTVVGTRRALVGEGRSLATHTPWRCTLRTPCGASAPLPRC